MYMSSCQDNRAKEKDKGAEHFSKLIGKVIDGLSGKERVGEEEIDEAWRNAAGDAAARHAKPVSFKKGSLVINVASSSWLYELSVRKKELMVSLEAQLKGRKIKELRFRIGQTKNKNQDEGIGKQP